ncbi:MAG: serine/threonine protein kinase with repeat [Gemmatimonadales bacterium]|nr:serine/threonine protein kinase with repeat [Gemmatimonadales bacterium]
MLENVKKVLESRYSIERELGRGGMATVYLAEDLRHDRRVAVKVLHPELSSALGPDRFLREIKLAARLNHPHIVPLFDSGEAGGYLFYVMPVVEGESLRDRLLRDGHIPMEEALQLVRGVASALDYAHRNNIVHRDIKPENVMLQEGEAMVMDFGIAKAVSVAAGDTLTQTGAMVGTPAYVSPEQAAGERVVDGRSDQYSLACVLYEMLSGRKPFAGATAQAVLSKRFTEPVPSIRSVFAAAPEEVESALGKALSKDASERFSTTMDFARALVATQLKTPGGSPLTTGGPGAIKSIAVLPFANMSADPEGEFFADGIAEEIINALSKIRALKVSSRTSSFTFKGKNEDIREIGRRLQVGTVLEGSVRKAGKRLRLTAQLVNAGDNSQLWAERYDRELEDVFAIQDDISQSIVAALRVVLSEDEKKAIEQVKTTNVEAYEVYLRARQYFHQHHRKSLEFALQMFERAIELDAGYALAYTGVADCCAFLYQYYDASQALLDKGETASKRALELAPGLAEAHASRGLALALNNRFDEAEEEFKTALRLDPRSFEAAYFYARACHANGKTEEAVKWFERAVAIRPDDFATLNLLATALNSLGRRDDATRVFRLAYDAARKHLELNPDNPRALYMGAGALSHLGESEKSREWNRRALAMEPDDAGVLYNIACGFALEHQTQEALTALNKAIDQGFGHWKWIEHDSDFDSIRNEPGFLDVLARRPVEHG